MTSRRRSHPSQDIPSDLLLNLHQQLARIEAMSLGNRQAMMEHMAALKEMVNIRFADLKEEVFARLARMDAADERLERRLAKLERSRAHGATGTPATGQATAARTGWLAGLGFKEILGLMSSAVSLAKLPLPWSTLGWWAAGVSASAYLMPKWVATSVGAALVAWGASGG